MSRRRKKGSAKSNARKKPTRRELTKKNIKKNAARTETTRGSGGRRGIIASAAIAAVAVAMVVSMANGFTGGDDPATADGPAESDTPAQAGEEQEDGQEQAVPLPRRLVMPTIGLNTRLVGLDRQKDQDAVELPPEHRAGWYKDSVRPGEEGVSVIVGYIDAAPTTPGVFTRLAQLEESDQVSVRSADGSLQVFTVSEIATYPEEEFPTKKVYGGTDQPELRLITSGGKLRDKDPRGNVVVYARLVDSR